jgi:hypothetical protein
MKKFERIIFWLLIFVFFIEPFIITYYTVKKPDKNVKEVIQEELDSSYQQGYADALDKNLVINKPVPIAFTDGQDVSWVDGIQRQKIKDSIPLYTKPQTSEWVGLSDSDREALAIVWKSKQRLMVAVENKLKEKNYGN